MTLVSICLNTYKRAEVIQCLESLDAQDCAGVSLSIVVSDNDSLGSGGPRVEYFENKTGTSVDYKIVPEKNIAVARNSAVARATGDWILFIDDDEVAPENWVSAMLKCATDFEADVVLGTVEARYTSGTEAWIAKQDPMSKRWGPTGKTMKMASTCSTLVKASWFKDRGFSFNPEYGRAGCDDAELFHRLYRAGAKIVVCAGAPLTEVTPLERANIEYLRKRFLRLGQSYAAITNGYRGRFSRLAFLVDASGRAAVFGTIALILRPIDLSKWLGFKLKFWRNVGKVQQTLRGTLNEMY